MFKDANSESGFSAGTITVKAANSYFVVREGETLGIPVFFDRVIGTYSSRVEGGAGLVTFMHGGGGYTVFIAVPAALVLAYIGALCFLNFKALKKQKLAVIAAGDLTGEPIEKTEDGTEEKAKEAQVIAGEDDNIGQAPEEEGAANAEPKDYNEADPDFNNNN